MPNDGKKMTFDRIQNVEHFFGDLCSEMSSITKKKARLRDKYDNIGRIVRGYSDVSRFNDTLFNGLLNFSKSCTLLADVKEMEVQRLQSKTVRDLASYENVCKNARETLKQSIMLRGKEQLKHRAQQKNSPIEKDENTQGIEESQSNFERNLLKFERQKISDIQQILMDFTLIQMKETVTSMEILTAMYNEIAAIDVDKDTEEFEQKFLNKDVNSLKPTNRSQSLSALASKPQPLKRSAISNSTMSLSSPNKDTNSKKKNGQNQTTESDTDYSESSKSTEESSESEEDESKSSSQTKQSSENQSSYLDDDNDDDDDAVRVHHIKKPSVANSEKRTAPVPQVRFSKLVNHMKK